MWVWIVICLSVLAYPRCSPPYSSWDRVQPLHRHHSECSDHPACNFYLNPLLYPAAWTASLVSFQRMMYHHYLHRTTVSGSTTSKHLSNRTVGSVLPNTNRKEREKQLNSKKEEEEEEIKKIRGAALFYLKVLHSGGSPVNAASRRMDR